MDRRKFLAGAALLSAALAGCGESDSGGTAEQTTTGATDTMPFTTENGQGAQALDIETILNWIRGDRVVSGCAPSDGTNAMEVDIASGEVQIDDTDIAVAAQTVTLTTGGTDPRKDLIWIDATGTVQVSEGLEAPYIPSGNTGFNTHQPSPPDSTGINGAIVAEVVVDAGSSDIDGTPGADLRDRRLLGASGEVSNPMEEPLDAGGYDISNVGAMDAGQGNITNQGVSYQVFTDGSTITAVPQSNPSGPPLSVVTDTDMGVVLRELLVNQLPPQGSETEGAGTITIKRGIYPFVDSTVEVPMVAQHKLLGEVSSHWISGGAVGRTQSEPPVVFDIQHSSKPFIGPNINTDRLTFVHWRDIELVGPGSSQAGSGSIDVTGSNYADWWLFERCIWQNFESAVVLQTVDNVMTFDGCHFLSNGAGGAGSNLWVEGGRSIISETNFWNDTAGRAQVVCGSSAEIEVRDCKFVLWSDLTTFPSNGMLEIAGTPQSVTGCHFRNHGTGSGDMVNIVSSGATVGPNNKFENNDGSPDGVFVNANQATVFGNHFYGTGSFNNFVTISSSSGTTAWNNTSNKVASNASVFVGSAASNTSTYNPELGGPINNTPTDTKWLNVIGGGPIGGVDIGSQTGASTGDIAMANGTSATNADTLWILKSTGDWQRVDGGSTITPV